MGGSSAIALATLNIHIRRMQLFPVQTYIRCLDAGKHWPPYTKTRIQTFHIPISYGCSSGYTFL